MKSTEKVLLTCEKFQTNSYKLFRELREDPDFCDVTLVCEDGQQILAHKVLIAGASPVIRNMLKSNKHSHPMLFFLGVKYRDLTTLIDFIYQGEAEIYQTDLDGFLHVAKGLAVRGLAETDEAQNSVDLKNENQEVSFETQVNNFENALYYNSQLSENYLQHIPPWMGLREYPLMEKDIEITTANPITQKEARSDVVENKIRMKEKHRNQKSPRLCVRLESFYELKDINNVMVANWAEKRLPGIAFCKICDSNVKFANGGRDLTNHSSTEKHKRNSRNSKMSTTM